MRHRIWLETIDGEIAWESPRPWGPCLATLIANATGVVVLVTTLTPVRVCSCTANLTITEARAMARTVDDALDRRKNP